MLLVIFVAVIFAAFYIRWRRMREYWRVRNVPYLPPHPILGNLTFLQRINPGIWMRQLNEHFKSPYVGVWWFWRPVLIVNSPDIARNILVKDFANFRNRLLSSGPRDPIGSQNIFTVNDPIWSDARRHLTKAFSSAKLKNLRDLLSLKSDQLVQRINNEIDDQNDLRMLYTDYTTDIITTYAFGIKSDATLTKTGAFRNVTKKFMTFDWRRGLAWSAIFFWPEVVNIFGFTFFPKSATDYFKRVFNTIALRDERVQRAEVHSIISILLKMREENTDSKVYTEDFIVAQAAILLFGGFDTTGTTLTFITYELAHNPVIQEKLYKELLDAKNQNGCDKLDDEQLLEIKYLDCVIKETLRIYTSMGWLDRIASNDYKIDDNLTIEAGTPIYINAMGMHYDPNYFPNPLKFDPDRFLPENEKNINPYTFMPFGHGPRACIGQRFAFMTLRSCISSLLLNYSIAPLPGRPKPSEIQIERRGLFYSPGEALSVKFVPRII